MDYPSHVIKGLWLLVGAVAIFVRAADAHADAVTAGKIDSTAENQTPVNHPVPAGGPEHSGTVPLYPLEAAGRARQAQPGVYDPAAYASAVAAARLEACRELAARLGVGRAETFRAEELAEQVTIAARPIADGEGWVTVKVSLDAPPLSRNELPRSIPVKRAVKLKRKVAQPQRNPRIAQITEISGVAAERKSLEPAKAITRTGDTLNPGPDILVEGRDIATEPTQMETKALHEPVGVEPTPAATRERAAARSEPTDRPVGRLIVYPPGTSAALRRKESAETQQQPAASIPTASTGTAPEQILKPTGLIIDAHAIDLRPAMIPRILGPDGEVLLDVGKIRMEKLAKDGIVGYALSLEGARRSPRVGYAPLVLKAAAGGQNQVDVILDRASWSALAGRQNLADLFRDGRVVVVIGNRDAESR